MARALGSLPLVSDAMRRGELSFAKVRAITRVATSESEGQLLELARCGTAADLERIVRAWRRSGRKEELEAERERYERRHLSMFVDDDGTYVVRGRLDPEVGALLMGALEAAEAAEAKPAAAAKQSPVDAADPETPTPPQRRADALRLVAEAALRAGFAADGAHYRTVSSADRFQVVLHVDSTALKDEVADDRDPDLSVLDGVRVAAETSRRLSERRPDGELIFRRPDGRRVPVVPPPPAAPLAAEWMGEVSIGPWTCAPAWNGKPLDLDFAVLTLRGG